ncbi:MAG: alpha/beta fold hydrolase [Candidatus Rokuibacteriota bacterium]|nr:MAG: alpha/beta fold hydrolase [Candidatus Rokubacteria bacterium]
MTPLAVERASDGRRPVVLLHGFLGGARNLASLAHGLAERDPDLGIVALDLTGHGASPPLPRGADSTTLAGDVLATVRALGLVTPLALVGHSLGGRVALRAALIEPAVARSVTLLDIAPGPLPAGGEVSRVLHALLQAPERVATRGEARATLVAAGLAPRVAEWLVLNLEPVTGGYRWRVDRRALAALHERIVAEDLWPAVERPRAYGVRCIRGGASPSVTAADVRRLEAARCAVVTIDGAGHLLHAERPQAVLEAVAAGLS